MKKKNILLGCLLLGGMLAPAEAQQAQFEKLNRGLVAVKTTDGVFLSWRSLITDDSQLAFDVYRDGVKINETPISKSTNYVDAEGTTASRYAVKAVVGNEEKETSTEVEVWADFYKRIHLQRPAGGTTPKGESYTYSPNDCSVGDVDGDGDYEIIVKWDPSNWKDNETTGYTGNVYLDCYEMEGGDYKWRIDLGQNIRAGAHYTQFMVYDLDGDGKAEVACKTAPGTKDGKGNFVLMNDDDPTADYRTTGSKYGHVISGPEYLTVFNGETGEEITTTAYSPLRSSVNDWGDNYGNRSERYLACVAYLDGQKPSLVMCRGYYARTALAAYDFDGSNLTLKWLLDDKKSGSNSAYGQGNHNLSVGDVDGDGCDEIVYGACCIDHDGTVLYRTGLGHGDAIHLGDFDPDREGLEVFSPHEEKTAAYGYDLHDARTGEIIFGRKTASDVGRGLVADIDPDTRGCEMWVLGYDETVSGTSTKINDVYNCKGEVVSTKRPSINFRLYWDGDLQEELLDGDARADKLKAPIGKWSAKGMTTLLELTDYENASPCNDSKGTPNLSGDILGDWREEVILYDKNTCSDLIIFTTTIPTEHKVTTLMHDHVYRMGMVWQNVAYNQPPHLGYYLPDQDTYTATFWKGSGALKQTFELGEPMEAVSYSWKNAETVELTGSLPEGVEMTKDDANATFTIAGKPTVTGTFNYTVQTVGGETTATLKGTITVKKATMLTSLACFPFDELSGTTTVNTVYGTAEAVGFTPTLEEGKAGQALTLPAAPAERRMQQASYDQLQLGVKDFTIETWFRSTGGEGIDWYLLHKGSHTANASTGASGKWFGIEYKNGELTFAIDDNVTKSTADIPATDYFNGEWVHLVCVRDHSNKSLKIYVNGILQGEAADNTGDISEQELFVIGNCNVNFNTPFTGTIDELNIYEGAMNATTVKNRYQDPTYSTRMAKGASAHAAFTVYPSLFTDQLTLECPAGLSGRTTVTIHSATSGASVHQGMYFMDEGSRILLTGLEALPAGSYILTIDFGTERFVKKLLKAN